MRRVLIRSAHAADAPALVALYADWGHPQPEAVIAECLAEWEATPYGRVLVAELDGAVAGFAGISASPHLARPGRFARLTGLAVAERFRRRGVATALISATESVARAWGCDRIEITSTRTRDEAPSFYASLDYDDASERQARYVRAL